MADALVGVNTTREVRWTLNGVPYTAGVFTYTLKGPDGSTISSGVSAVAHVGSGRYQVTLDGDLVLTGPGLYRETWVDTTASAELRRDGFFLARYPEGPLVTRLDLRHACARHVGDLWTGVATSATSTTLADTNRSEPNNYWRGARLYLYGGTGAGQERTVSSYAQTGGVFTVSQAWSPTPDTTTRYELHHPNASPFGAWSVDDYNDALNSALREIAVHTPMAIVDETVQQVDNQYEYTVPAGFWALSAVWQRDTSATTNDWLELSRRAGDWALVRGRRMLRLRSPSSTNRLRLIGWMQPDQMWLDSSYCDVDPAWVEWRAADTLLTPALRGGRNDRTGMLARIQQRVQEIRQGLPRVQLANALRVL